MKITNVSNFMNYKNSSAKINKNDVVKSKKFDTILINKNNTINIENNNVMDVDKIKNKIVNELNSETNLDKIEQIKNQINSKTYVVNADELANIMLEI